MPNPQRKSPGKRRIILFFFIIVYFSYCGYAAELETSIDSSVIGRGESTTLRVKISGSGGNITPRKIASSEGLEIRYTGMQSSFQFINGRTWSGIILTFNVRALKEGDYKIPPIVLEIDGSEYSSSEVPLSVTSSRQGGAGGSGNPGALPGIYREEVRLETYTSFSKDCVYAGEPLIMRYFMLSSGIRTMRLDAIEEMPSTSGFVIAEMPEKIAEETVRDERGGELIKSHLVTYVLISAGSGEYTIGGGSIIATVDSGRGFFSSSRRRFRFDESAVKVLPLPSADVPDAYKGDVGDFTLEAVYDRSPVNRFEGKNVKVKLRGSGNLLTVSDPAPVSAPSHVKIITGDGETVKGIKGNSVAGAREYSFTLIPEKSGEVKIEGFKLAYFNPEKKQYFTALSGPVLFEVKDSGTASSGIEFDESAPSGISLRYPAAAGFILISGIAALLIWERRRLAALKKPAESDGDEKQASASAASPDRALALIDRALSEEDYSLFLSASDNFAGGFSGTEAEDLKNLIQACRFGGRALGAADAADIRQKMEKLMADDNAKKF